MQPDQGTLVGQVVAGIVTLLVGGFIIFKIIQALAAFVDALEDRPEKPIKDEVEDEQK